MDGFRPRHQFAARYPAVVLLRRWRARATSPQHVLRPPSTRPSTSSKPTVDTPSWPRPSCRARPPKPSSCHPGVLSSPTQIRIRIVRGASVQSVKHALSLSPLLSTPPGCRHPPGTQPGSLLPRNLPLSQHRQRLPQHVPAPPLRGLAPTNSTRRPAWFALHDSRWVENGTTHGSR
jgi:hypothetical protein